jgi:hypothetical protein
MSSIRFSSDVTGGQGDDAIKYIDEMTKIYSRARQFAKESKGESDRGSHDRKLKKKESDEGDSD